MPFFKVTVSNETVLVKGDTVDEIKNAVIGKLKSEKVAEDYEVSVYICFTNSHRINQLNDIVVFMYMYISLFTVNI